MQDLERSVSRVVGKEGKVNQRANFRASRAWRHGRPSTRRSRDSVWSTTEVTRTIGAVAKGDLSQTMSLEMEGRPLQGEFLRSAKLVNTMIGQLSVFTGSDRVAREVGTEGKLGGQAQVKDVAGVWKDLHRQCQYDGRQPHGQGGISPRSPLPWPTATSRRSRSMCAVNSPVEEAISHPWSISSRSFAAEVTRVAGKSERKASSAVKRKSPASRELGKISPIPSTPWPATSRPKSAILPKWRRRWRGGHFPQDHGGCPARSSSSRTRSTPWSIS